MRMEAQTVHRPRCKGKYLVLFRDQILNCLYRALDDVSALIKEFLDELERQTGWCWSLIGGGPTPNAGGKIQVTG